MTTQPPAQHQEPSIHTAAPLSRAERYYLVGRALQYPDDLERLVWDLERASRDAVAPGDEDARATVELARALLPLVDEALPFEHNRLFAQAAPIAVYETSYAFADKGAALGQLAALYEAWGVKAGGTEHEALDHIGAELELASVLSVKEAFADSAERASMCREARRILLCEHLGRFAPTFARKLREATRHGFFAVVATGIEDTVKGDLARHGWTADPVRPSLFVVDDDAEPLACPMASDGDDTGTI